MCPPKLQTARTGNRVAEPGYLLVRMRASRTSQLQPGPRCREPSCRVGTFFGPGETGQFIPSRHASRSRSHHFFGPDSLGLPKSRKSTVSLSPTVEACFGMTERSDVFFSRVSTSESSGRRGVIVQQAPANSHKHAPSSDRWVLSPAINRAAAQCADNALDAVIAGSVLASTMRGCDLWQQ